MYAIVPGPLFTPAKVAVAPSRHSIESAVADMGTGVVVSKTTMSIAAFHESHLPMVERLGKIREV